LTDKGEKFSTTDSKKKKKKKRKKMNEWDVESIPGYNLIEQLHTLEVSQRVYLAKQDLSHQYVSSLSSSSDRVTNGAKSALILTGSTIEIDHEKEILFHVKQCNSNDDWKGYAPLIEGLFGFTFVFSC